MPTTLAQVMGFWFSTPNVPAAEMAASLGYRTALIDIEHGTFDLATLDRFIPFVRQLGMFVMAKVLTPERGPIQQALDFGADAVVIPHVQNAKHAEEVAAYAKFPDPTASGRRERSFAGGRVVGYQFPYAEFFKQTNERVRCLPLIETPGSLEEIEAILALPTVDGVFVGPTDLSLRRGRGMYSRTEADKADIQKIAQAAKQAGKPWYVSAWNTVEREIGSQLGAAAMICTMEQAALFMGMAVAKEALVKEFGN